MEKRNRLMVNLEGLDSQMQLKVFAELQKFNLEEAIATEVEQIEAAYQEQQQRKRSIDGVGQQLLMISPQAFLHFKVVEGMDFSSAKDRKWLTSRHPSMKANCGGVRNTFGWEPTARREEATQLTVVSGGERRSRTVYG